MGTDNMPHMYFVYAGLLILCILGTDHNKHSDKEALQGVSSNVINACIEVASLVKTDVPELRRPWFSSGHEKIGSVIFVTVSLERVVFFTDDTNCA